MGEDNDTTKRSCFCANWGNIWTYTPLHREPNKHIVSSEYIVICPNCSSILFFKRTGPVDKAPGPYEWMKWLEGRRPAMTWTQPYSSIFESIEESEAARGALAAARRLASAEDEAKRTGIDRSGALEALSSLRSRFEESERLAKREVDRTTTEYAKAQKEIQVALDELRKLGSAKRGRANG